MEDRVSPTMELSGAGFNVFDLVDAEIAQDPNALQRALTMLPPEKAVEFYLVECTKNNVSAIQSFIKQIRTNAAVLNFENNYFGKRGIIPVLATIQHMAVVEVRLSNCELSAEDIGRIQKALAQHSTIATIDLRGNPISLPSSRKILSLAIQNRRITSLLVDDGVPKCIFIQRQCLANANVAVHTSACVVCQKSMVHSVAGCVEQKVLLAIHERLTGAALLSAAEVETLFRCLLSCTDVNDGVLFLCSDECISSISNDIVQALRSVTDEVYHQLKGRHMKHPVIARCIVEIVERYCGKSATVSNTSMEMSLNMLGASLRSKAVTNNYQQKAALIREKYAEYFLVVPRPPGDPKESDWKACTICGKSCVPLVDGANIAVRLLAEDLKRNVELRPSALLRVIHTMLKYSKMKPCGIKCVRHLVRYAITGFGGVLRSMPDPSEALLSTVGVSLQTLPDCDFCVVDFGETTVLDHGEEDTTCAVTVASLMTDIDGLSVCPYLIFAVGRFLAKRELSVLGMELRHACEAVRVVGCLASDGSPFRRKNRPQRTSYAEWNKWSQVADVDMIQKMCFSRRRQAYYVVDGPSDNAFDRTRAALWAFRDQHRCVAVVLKFTLHWMKCDKGMIPVESPPKGGFYTTVKIIGQTRIQNMFYLVLQPNFGPLVGNRGFFYMSRSTFNRSVRGGLYMFVDTNAIRESFGAVAECSFAKMVPPSVLRSIESPAEILRVLNFLGSVDQRQVNQDVVGPLQKLLKAMPLCLLFSFIASGQQDCAHFAGQRALMKKLHRRGYGKTQLAFLWNEVLGANAARWVQSAVAQLLELGGSEGSSAVFPMDLSTSMANNSRQNSSTVHPQGTAISVSIAQSMESNTPVSGGPSRPGGLHNPIMPATYKDPKRRQLEIEMQMEREMLLRTSFGNSQQAGGDSLDGAAPTGNASSSLSAPAAIPLALLGKNWSALALPNAKGESTETLLCFIQDKVCRYHTAAQEMTSPLRPFTADPALKDFPFPTGFDCTFVWSKRRVPHAFFFADQQWIEWDLHRHRSIVGPCTIGLHKQFRELPRSYHARVDAALEIPNTDLVFLFSQFDYVVFDLKNCAVSQRYTPSVPCLVRNPDGLFSRWAEAFPRGPMATVKLSHTRTMMIGFNGLVIEDEVSAHFDAFKDNNGRAPANRPATSPITSTSLRHLPNSFLQTTCSTADEMTQSLLNSIPSNRLLRVALFRPSLPPAHWNEMVSRNLALKELRAAWPVEVTSTIPLAQATTTGGQPNNDPLWTATLTLDSTKKPAKSSRSPTPSSSSKTTAYTLRELIVPLSMRQSAPAPLLTDCVLLRQHEASADPSQHSLIDFDFGTVNTSAFAYVQVLLDVSMLDARILHLAPISTRVECSTDGVTYVTVSTLNLTGTISGGYWNPVHSSRFWRLRFLDEIPVGVGVINVLWHTAEWVNEGFTYNLTDTFQVSPKTCVHVEADMLLKPPAELLQEGMPQSVFRMPSTDRWWPRHAVLPLLPHCESCLFFRGAVCVEYDFVDEVVVTNRSISLAQHPSFRDIPFPFCDGFDAIFYPDVRIPNQVVIVRDDRLILWDLYDGCQVSNPVLLTESTYFKGIPLIFHRFQDMINIWENPGHVFVFVEEKVFRWNVLEQVVVEGPYSREQIPVFHAPQFASKPFLAVTSFPSQPKTFYIFCENQVVVHTIDNDRGINRRRPSLFRTCEFFCVVARYLQWGEAFDETSVVFDFADRCPMIVGLSMRCHNACPGTQWRVEFSEDNSTWQEVSTHHQDASRASTAWSIDQVKGQSHRFWKLTSVPRTTIQTGDTSEMITYSDVQFDVLPSQLLTEKPISIESTSGISATTASVPRSTSLLSTAETDRLMEGKMALSLSAATKSSPQYFVVDFGPEANVSVVGVSYLLKGSRAAEVSKDAPATSMNLKASVSTWTVYSSADGLVWWKSGSWRVRSELIHLQWAPTAPRRFWKFELTSSLAALHLQEIKLFESLAPMVRSGDGLDRSRDVCLLHDKFRCDPTAGHPLRFTPTRDNTLVVAFNRHAQSLVGVSIEIDEVRRVLSTSFVVECNGDEDSAEWNEVAGPLTISSRTSTLRWQEVGRYPRWRLRVVDKFSSACCVLAIAKVTAIVSGPSLYIPTSSFALQNPAGMKDLRELYSFVGVRAVVPPRSMYLVQQQQFVADGFQWVSLGLLTNVDDKASTCVAHWALPHASPSWRLVVVPEFDSNASQPQGATSLSTTPLTEVSQQSKPSSAHSSRDCHSIIWLSFAGTQLHPSYLSSNDVVQSVSGFEHFPTKRRSSQSLLTSNTNNMSFSPVPPSASAAGHGSETPLPVSSVVVPASDIVFPLLLTLDDPQQDEQRVSVSTSTDGDAKNSSSSQLPQVWKVRAVKQSRADDSFVTWNFGVHRRPQFSAMHVTCRAVLLPERPASTASGVSPSAAAPAPPPPTARGSSRGEAMVRSSTREAAKAALAAAAAAAAPPPVTTPLFVRDEAYLSIELSDDGHAFIPVCTYQLPLISLDDSNNGPDESEVFRPHVLQWDAVYRASFWRLRCTSTSPRVLIDIGPMQIFTKQGIMSFSTSVADLNPLRHSPLNYEKWVSAVAFGDLHLRERLMEGLQQCDSVTTGLRAAGDIDEVGTLTQTLQTLQKAFQKTMVRRVKENRELAGVSSLAPLDLNIMIQAIFNQSNDSRFEEILQLLTEHNYYEMTAAPNADADVAVTPAAPSPAMSGAVTPPLSALSPTLLPSAVAAAATLLSAPVKPHLTSQEMKLAKDSVSWCGPKSEYRGTATQPIFGIPEISISLSMRWMLTPHVLRCYSELLPSNVSPHSPVLSSPLLLLNITKADWFAGTAFPQLPLLYEFSITEKPVTLALTTGPISFFPPTVVLPIPQEKKELSPKHSFTLHSGINFLAQVRLRDCPSPMMTYFNSFLAPNTLDKTLTHVVLTVDSFHATKALFAFTIPVSANVNFGISLLSMPTLSVEIRTNLEERDPLLRRTATFACPDAALSSSLSLGASSSGSAEGSVLEPCASLKVHLAGELLPGGVCVVRGRGYCGAYLTNPMGLSGARFSNISFSTRVLRAEAPFQFRPSMVFYSGTLSLDDTDLHFPARMELRSAATTFQSGNCIIVQLQNASLAVVVALCARVTGAPCEVEPWMSEIPLHVTAEVLLFPKRGIATTRGEAVVSFYNQFGPCTLSFTKRGLRMKFSLLKVDIGDLRLTGSADAGGLIPIEVTSGTNAIASVRLDGVCALLSPRAYPCQVELSSLGTVVASTGSFFDMIIKDESLHPACAYATVTISKDIFVAPLGNELLTSPIIATLVGNGMPFSFCVNQVLVTSCVIEARAMQVVFRGILFGFGYEVSVSLYEPENTLSMIHTVCDIAASHIIEQCSEALWASLDTFVGCVHDDAEDLPSSGSKGGRESKIGWSVTEDTCEEEEEDTFLHDSAKARGMIAREGTFVSMWLAKECDEADQFVENAVETV